MTHRAQARRLNKTYSGIGSTVAKWNKRADDLEAKLKTNPFSDQWEGPRKPDTSDARTYGKPVEGSLTDMRGKKAGRHVSNEVCYLCSVIKRIGHQEADGTFGVYFGKLFQVYTVISNKVVGILLRARRHGLVDFPGEILYQRRDENVFIRLIKLPYDEKEDPFWNDEVPPDLDKETPETEEKQKLHLEAHWQEVVKQPVKDSETEQKPGETSY